jgi:hypothetical protein
MNVFKIHESLAGLLAALVLFLFIPLTGLGQTEKLGTVSYVAPAGFTRTTKENSIAFSTYDQSTAKFCIITLYGATPGTGRAESDFKREWGNLVVKNMTAEPNPKTESHTESGWTATGGGSPIEFEGGKAFALLAVMSGVGRTVSVLGVFSDESCISALAAFSDSVVLGTAVANTPATTVTPQIQNGRLVIPPISRQLSVADLVGEWGENAGITTTYVDRYSGTYAGFESLHFTSKMTITPNGGFHNDFFALQNGRKIKENTSGSISISGRVLSIRHKNLAKYVIRGWLELPDITILEICGPWYDNDPIPADIFTDPNKGWNLDKKWVRKR